MFGKTIENIRKHRDINLVTNEETYFKRVMKPNFNFGIRFSLQPNGVRDVKDSSHNEQTHIPGTSYPQSE